MLMLLLSLHMVTGPTPPTMRAPMHYKIVAKTTSDIDLSAMGQPSQSIVLTVSGFVSVSITDTVGGKLANITVDSSAFDAGMFTAQMPPEMTASSKGTVFHIYLVNGKASAPIAPTPAGIQAGQLVPGIELMLAGMRPTKAADSWIDSTASDSAAVPGGTAMTRVTTWTAKAGAGGRMQIEGTWTGTTTVGAGSPMKMDMQMTGTVHVTSMPGALSEFGTSTGNGQASMNIAGSAIPMKVTAEVTTTATP